MAVDPMSDLNCLLQDEVTTVVDLAEVRLLWDTILNLINKARYVEREKRDDPSRDPLRTVDPLRFPV